MISKIHMGLRVLGFTMIPLASDHMAMGKTSLEFTCGDLLVCESLDHLWDAVYARRCVFYTEIQDGHLLSQDHLI